MEFRSILHGYFNPFSLLVLMGISTFASKEFVIFCRVSKIGNEKKHLWNGVDFVCSIFAECTVLYCTICTLKGQVMMYFTYIYIIQPDYMMSH